MLRTFVKDAAGALVVNSNKLFVQHFMLVPETPNEYVTFAANAASPPLVFRGRQEGPTEFYQWFLKATDLSKLLCTRLEYRKRLLSNNSIHAATLFGGLIPTINGVSPSYLAETLWLLMNETLIMQFLDYSGNPQTMGAMMAGRLFLHRANPQAAKVLNDVGAQADASNQVTSPFWYTTDDVPLSLTASQTTQRMIHIAADGAFELHKIAAVSTGEFTLRIWDANAGRALTSGPIHSDFFSGTGRFPYVLPEPLLMLRNSQFQLEFTDISGKGNDIYLTLAGRRIYAGDEALN